MFKFATNKFSSHNNHHQNVEATSTTAPIHHHHHVSSSSGSAEQTSSTQTNKRRQLQKDLFAYNKIADKGFPSKPSAMDYDKKLKMLAIGTKNGDIRIYSQPNTRHQQLSSYQDIHPFPIQRLLFIQGQYQLITLSERVSRNDLTNKGESHIYLILWQIPQLSNDQQQQQHPVVNLIEKVKEYQLDPKIINTSQGIKLSALTLLNDNSHLFMGFETGDVYVFNVSSFQLVPGVINKDYILKNIPESATTKKLNQLGAVESIAHHPRQLTKLLIAYERGLWIIFDFIRNQIDQINQTQQPIESAIFYQYGECVATSHSDGSFILWDLISQQQQQQQQQQQTAVTAGDTPTVCTSNSSPNIVYGPYPCKPVSKCLVKTCKNDQPLVIFSGGCPRVNYSDKITISVIQGENAHVCFDFTSKIIDFFTIDKPFVEKTPAVTSSTASTAAAAAAATTTVQYDNPQALFVLLEEEFVAIDLISDNWPQYRLPYLYSVHSSAIICTHYVNCISRQFYDKLKSFDQNEDVYSDREWPIYTNHQIDESNNQNTSTKDLLLTGHEDGSIRFWDVTNQSMELIYSLKTSEYFQSDSMHLDSVENDAEKAEQDEEENWPPFRKVGTFDPYSDDPKLGIQKLHLCPQRQILVVAGTAGQVLIMSLNDASRDISQPIQPHRINLIGVSPEVESHFVWKGHEPMQTRQSMPIKLRPGYQLISLVQLYPPATISAISLQSDWQLVAMGTSHGFALFDYNQMKDLLVRCTLDPAVLLAANQQQEGANNSGTISRRKSLKKSLRESFRKLRRGRSQKPNKNSTITTRNNNPILSSMSHHQQQDDQDLNDNHRPIERQVESREFKPMDDIPPSVIRYMYFVRTHITSQQQQTNSLWVGTNTGIIYIYALQFMLNSAHLQQLTSAQNHRSATTTTSTTTMRSNQSINCLLAKEMRLKHRAPVVHIQVIDQNMNPLPISQSDSKSNNQIQAQDNESINHKVIICSEEQFKVFQLPTLKPVCKFKLTAIEGARVRRIGYTRYTSRNDQRYSEYCLSCLSNLGDLSVFSLPQLKRQVQVQCMKQQDINAITSFVFSKQGQAFYLQSPSEFVHISMSARDSPTMSIVTTTATPAITTQAQSPNTKSCSKNPQPANTNNNTKKNHNANQVTKSSTSPPVPAPRSSTSTHKDFNNTTTSSNNSSSSTKDEKEFNNSKKINNLLDNISPVKSTPPAPVAIDNNNDLPKPKEDKTQKGLNDSLPKTENNSIARSEEAECDLNKTGATTTTTAAIPQAAINLNQSINNLAAISNNCSMITAGDSFNVSSSGYNGSGSIANTTTTTTTTTNNINMTNVDISMDSVVERFNDNEHDVSTNKKIPSSLIDECIGVVDNQDSLLNISEMSNDLSNRLNLTSNTKHSNQTTNGYHHHNHQRNGSATAPAPINGITNGVHHTNSKTPNGKACSSSSSSSSTSSSSSSSASSTNQNEDDYNNISNMSPQKASSPLIKQQTTNANNQSSHSRVNKIEQVTKRIENGSKLEYRETVID